MKVKTMQAGEVESIEVYGVRRKLLGHYTEDGGPYCRLLFEGGKAYWFAVPYGKGNEAPTGEPPHTVIEAPDGNGDLLTYSDGKTYRTGGAMIPFSAADAAFLHSMKTAHAEADPATAGGVQSGTGKQTRKPRVEWSSNAQDRVANIWKDWKGCHNTQETGGRELDCYNENKADMPDTVKTFADFRACKECARKNGRIPKYNRKRRKSAG